MLKSENNHFKDNLKHYIDIYYNKHEKFKLYKFIYSANIRKIGKNKWKIRVRLQKMERLQKMSFCQKNKVYATHHSLFSLNKNKKGMPQRSHHFLLKKTKMKWKPQKNKIQETSIFKASQQLVYEFRGHIQRCIKKPVKYI